MQSKILTPLNQIMQCELYSLEDPAGDPIMYSTLNGLPIGTHDGTAQGTLGVKVIIVGGNITVGSSAVPTDNLTFSYIGDTNNIDTIEYRNLSDELVATTVFTYVDEGAADDDLIETMVTTLE